VLLAVTYQELNIHPLVAEAVHVTVISLLVVDANDNVTPVGASAGVPAVLNEALSVEGESNDGVVTEHFSVTENVYVVSGKSDVAVQESVFLFEIPEQPAF
jgi:hypothetical protein